MGRSLRLLLAVATLVLVVGAAALPAGAGDSRDDQSENMKLLFSSPQTSFINSDLAFWKDRVFAGNYGGVRIFDIAKPAEPKLLASLACPAAQNDVSVWEDLLFVSVDRPLESSKCDSPSADPPTKKSAFEGVRIFRVSEILKAKPDPADQKIKSVDPIAAVPTDCGSHTHTLIPDLDDERLLIYVSSYAIRSGPRCGPENAKAEGYDPLHRKISIIEVPLDKPKDAKVIATPKIEAPVYDLADLGETGFHPTVGCHDIQVFRELKLAAAACLSDGQLWDISDLEHPRTTKAVHIDNPHVQFWHSAAFTWDGKQVIFGDEVVSGNGTCGDRAEGAGRLWFYPVSSKAEKPLGSFQIPRSQGDKYCSAHLFNVIPRVDRQVLVASWYEGGTTVVDFTDPASPEEIGYYDARRPVPADTWASYWYNDFLYANDGVEEDPTDVYHRGFDVLQLTDPVGKAPNFSYMNPQTQESLIR
ncbi:MAG: LVIVD repeat-containing protein [Actinomycetota bacterium]